MRAQCPTPLRLLAPCGKMSAVTCPQCHRARASKKVFFVSTPGHCVSRAAKAEASQRQKAVLSNSDCVEKRVRQLQNGLTQHMRQSTGSCWMSARRGNLPICSICRPGLTPASSSSRSQVKSNGTWLLAWDGCADTLPT